MPRLLVGGQRLGAVVREGARRRAARRVVERRRIEIESLERGWLLRSRATVRVGLERCNSA